MDALVAGWNHDDVEWDGSMVFSGRDHRKSRSNGLMRV
jgi:hypothetical protein